MSWSPCGQFLAVGSYDQMLRVLNHLTWKTFAEFMHPNSVRGPCYAAVFKVFLFDTFMLMVLQFMKTLLTLSLKLQEVDEPLQLDMSELCLSDDFSQGNDGKHNLLWEPELFW